MDLNRIASVVAFSAVPVVTIAVTLDGGLLVTASRLQEAWSNAKSRMGFDHDWIPASLFIQAHGRRGKSLEGLERLVADKVASMTSEAVAGGYREVAGLGMDFAVVKSACRFCPDKKRLVGLSIEARR